MTVETRLANLYRYRDEALKDPESNKLYLADLTLSIKMFEEVAKKPRSVKYQVLSGMSLD
jgi:hypothetical protein